MPGARSAYQPRKTPQQRRAWQTRQRIEQAAARVFTRYGYASGTTDRIAEEAGLSIGSLYQYFPNKGAILLVLAQAHLEEMSHAVDVSLAEPRPLGEWLPELTRTLVELHAVNPRLHRVLFEEAPRPPELLARFHQAEGQAAAAVEALLRADPGPKVAEPARKARFVVATVESLIHRFIGRAPQVDEQEPAEEIVLIVTRCLR